MDTPIDSPLAGAPRWEDVTDTLRSLAEIDLRADGQLRPTILAFDGDRALAAVELRPAERPERPVVEALSLLAHLGTRRLALSIGTRVWSMDDPIPPVLDGVGDLRQQAVMILTADTDADGDVALDGILHPFELGGAGPVWDRPVPIGMPDEDAWITGALRAALLEASSTDAGPSAIRASASRCERRGHRILLAPLGSARLGVTVDAPVPRPAAED